MWLVRSTISDRRRRWLAIWCLGALINLSAGLVLATEPVRHRDLLTVRGWSGQWLMNGENLYASSSSRTDYPPHAILLLSPLSVVPESPAIVLWVALSLCLALIAPYLAARVIAPRPSADEIVCLTLLFLCWSGTKTFLQFSLLTLVFGLAATALADRRPHWSALCLGVAAMKPQIAVPFVLWMLFARHWKIALESLLLVVIMSFLFCIRAHASPVDVAVRYTEILGAFHTGRYSLVGASHLHPLVARFVPAAFSDAATVLISCALLAVVCARGLFGAKTRTRVNYATLAMGAVWSLLTFYHLTYGFVLLLPTSALLLLTDDRSTADLRRLTFWSLQAALIVDVPGVWRRIGPFFPRSPADTVFADFDRLLALVLFAALFVITRRMSDVAAPC